MAKRREKKTKKVYGLWAARMSNKDSDVDLFQQRPNYNGKCDSCGQHSYWTGDLLYDGFCHGGFERSTGIVIKPGECVQLKVTRVEKSK
ncbi:MAG: hypothetical protein L0Z53_06715 [Acidobacteriales bacterium]|nr:hypothetical protein [Terriglobales bacterium]